MLKITIKPGEFWDVGLNSFVSVKEHTILLEHSLRSISKWESKNKIPFLDHQMTYQEILDYIRCMTITQNVNPLSYQLITKDQIEGIQAYIDMPMTATTVKGFKHQGYVPKKEIVTNELIYYWMIVCGIPFECEKWNFNRLMTLIEVCFAKNAPAKKMSRGEVFSQNKALNAARRAKMGSKG